ncbi:MAG: chitobiase/beta-hexosaminidase C-terminal domain-containing protein [Bergeyella sp.]
MKKKLFLALSAILLAFPAKGQEYLDDIMMQSFGWDEYQQTRNVSEGGLYEFYASRAGNLKALGFDMIWMPPPSASTGGVGYFPTQWFNFTQTSWGSEAQLLKMLSNMNARGINPIADIVVNHRSGTTGWTDFTNPTWGCETICIDDDATAAYDAGQYTGCRPSGASDTGEAFGGSRDLDHTNLTVQNGVKEYLGKLKTMGFKGWRWDVAKGFSSYYFGMYIADSQPYYSVGENWESNATNLKNWINGTYAYNQSQVNISGAFDFPLYYTLSSAVKSNSYTAFSGSVPGLAGEYGFSEKSVTFLDNHDTFAHDDSYFSGSNILKGYAYILTHPGIPCVWAPHYYGGTYTKDSKTRTYAANSAKINQMMAVRKANGIDAYSHVVVDKAQIGLYAAYIKKRSTDTDPVVAMKLGGTSWTPSGTGWTLAVSGTDFSIWSKATVNVAPIVVISPASGTFVNGSTQSVTISATDDSGTAPTIRYTIDGSDPTASSPVYTGALSVSSNTVVKAIAIDAQGLSSGVVERIYTFADTKDIVIRFKPPTGTPNWPSPKIHYWDYVPTTSLPAASWASPISMTADSENSGWFKYTFNNILKVSFLFRDGSSTGTLGVTQTGDITNVTKDSWYVWDATSSTYVREVEGNMAVTETDAEKNKIALEIMENPVNNKIAKIRYKNAKNAEIFIVDLTGKTVKSLNVSKTSGDETISVNGLTSGIYIVQLKAENGTATAKMIVK